MKKKYGSTILYVKKHMEIKHINIISSSVTAVNKTWTLFHYKKLTQLKCDSCQFLAKECAQYWLTA